MKSRGSPFCLLLLVAAACPATAQPFVDRSDALGLALGGSAAAWADINQDGWPDLYCAGKVWLNQGGESFTRINAKGSGVVADIDNDGLPDLVSFAPIAVLRNIDGERFEPVELPELPKTISRGVAVGDYNSDGFVDLYFGGYEVWEPTTYPDLLLLNEAGRGFRLAERFPEHRARGVTACDFDEDGDLDVYVSNYRLMPNVLRRNDGNGAFEDAAPALNAVATSEGFGGGHSIGACWGDFDNDGRFDLFAGNFAHVDSRGDQPKSRFLRNRGPGGETPFGFDDLGECGVWYQESYASPAAADFDNDGDLDLFFTTVYATASFNKKNHPVLFRNDTAPTTPTTPDQPAWVFTDATDGSGLESLPPTYQAAWADFDRDGDLDLVTAGRLFVNESAAANHWLQVRLVGDGEQVNTSAIGTQVRIRLPDGRTLTRQVEAGTGEGNANDLTLHFGLGGFDEPVRVEIRWPNRVTQLLPGVAPDQVLTVRFSTAR
ncbi:MAG: CRTAC1 family protein [Phycisphaerales bacterium JB054]